MTSPESIALIRRAKAGDRQAWGELCQRYYPRWLKEYHGQLGPALRQLHDTVDLVQSAIAEALKDIGDLRCEAAFYCWVSTIIRRKIASKRKKSGRLEPVRLDDVDDIGRKKPPSTALAFRDEDYGRLLDALLELFPLYPAPMAAVYLKYFEKLTIPSLMQVFGKSERSAHRLIETGLALLRSKLDGK
ncbi:MAG: hypothetical protein HY721_15320 [Planctomycetes bacterium]|nr:hypothetical protein [Planctomycetota bacterium]